MRPVVRAASHSGSCPRRWRNNLTAMRTPRKTPILITQPLVASGMTPLMVPPRMPPLMMAAHTDGSQPKKQRKDRRPNALRTLKEEFTQVDSDGNPTEPKHIAKGYSLQLGCILRSTVSINTENLRHKDRGNLGTLLFTKLHERYKFPAEFENTRLSGNKVNNVALTKMSTTLSTWRSAVKRMIDKGDSYDKIKAKYPLMSKDDYKEFKIKCKSPATSESS